MIVNSILKMGNPNLINVAKKVENISSHKTDLNEIIQKLFDTMKFFNGAGLAAPQINISKRIIVFGFDFNPRYPNEKPIPLTALINPTYIPLSEEKIEDWEGCLSLPQIRGKVPRYKYIEYKGYNADGNLISSVIEGFPARIIQHECDHLDGILFPARVLDFKYFGFENEFHQKK